MSQKYPDRQLYAKFDANGVFAGAVLGGAHSDEQIDAFIAAGAIPISHEDHALYQEHQYIPDDGGFWSQHLYYVCRDGQPVRVSVTPTDTEIFTFYQQKKITELTSYLDATDYKQMQWMDGRCTDEEYAPIKALRLEWNTKVRTLKGAKTLAEVQNVTYEKYIKGA